MKKEIVNCMNSMILKICFTVCFICFLSLGSIWSQNGKVPPLVSIQDANQRLIPEIKLLTEQINTIEAAGGTADPELKFKLQLYTSVNDLLVKNDIGMTTFNVIAGNSNYKSLVMDDEAFRNLLAGIWDQNMTDLIRILAK